MNWFLLVVSIIWVFWYLFLLLFHYSVFMCFGYFHNLYLLSASGGINTHVCISLLLLVPLLF